MKRGPKPKERNKPRAIFDPKPPRHLKGRERAHYVSIAEDLASEGFASQTDWRTVELAARAAAHVERIEGEVAKLESLTTVSRGAEKVHPLVAELRQARTQLAAFLGQLLLTPRSRSASRLASDQRQPKNVGTEPDSGDRERILTLLG